MARSFEVRNVLVRAGAVPDPELHGSHEIWRVRLGRTVLTGYANGTIYSTGGTEPELAFLYRKIDEVLEGH